MKFGFSVFIGIFLLLLGISIFLEQLFRIDLPLGKLFLAGSFIYIGYQLIKSRLGRQRKGAHADEPPPVEFGDHNVKAKAEDPHQTFKYIFSSGTVDLRELPQTSQTIQQPIIIKALFSDIKVSLRADQMINLKSKSVFGSITQAHKQSSETSQKNDSDALKVFCHSIFSSVTFEYPQSTKT